jgi:hypothetical protein
MKRETAHYVLECDTCQKVNADYIKPKGLLQPLSVPDCKWDDISIELRSMLRSTLLACYVCMEPRRRSSLIEGHSLLLALVSNCLCPSGLT